MTSSVGIELCLLISVLYSVGSFYARAIGGLNLLTMISITMSAFAAFRPIALSYLRVNDRTQTKLCVQKTAMRCFIPASKGRRRLEDISSPSNIRTGTCRKVYIVVFTICEFQLFCPNLCVLSESSEWPVPRFRFLLDGLHLLLGRTPQHR